MTTEQPCTDLDALQQALDALVQPAAVRNGGGRYLAVNAAMAELLGLPADRICGKPDSALQPADLANHSAEIDGLVLGSGMPMDSDEHVLCRFGRRRLRAARLPLLDGEAPWAVALVLTDVEEPDAASAARDRLAAALAAEPVTALAPPVPEVARREREEETQAQLLEAEERAAAEAARAEQAEARAAEAEERANALQDRVNAVLAELRAARLDADALLRRAADAPDATEPSDVPPTPVVAWGEADDHRLAAALRGAPSVRAAARSLLTTIGPAAGYAAGAVWRVEEDGALRCVGAWSAPGEDVGGWETTTWHAALRDGGLVPDARGAAPAAHPTTGDDPRCEVARQAGLGAAVTFGAGADTIVELLRREPSAEPLEALEAAREVLAETLARLDETDADRPAWAAARL